MDFLGFREIVDKFWKVVLSYFMQALIFDSFYDRHRGVVAYIRLFAGRIAPKDTVYFLATDSQAEVLEVGFFKPQMETAKALENGEVGYLMTGLKDLGMIKVGDTISNLKDPKMRLTGYQEVKPKVFASIFPSDAGDYPKLRDAMNKLKMNDASLTFETENIAALGFGFRCGFLGLLHLDIVQERLSREFDLDLVVTTPSVEYRLLLQQSKFKNNLENKSSEIDLESEANSQKISHLKTQILELTAENWQNLCK